MKLPLEYHQLSSYFDVLSHPSMDSRNALIEKLLKKHKVNTVLDLSCGTGSQTLWLAKRGYQMTGADLSPALIKIAKQKVRRENLKVKLLEGDMRTLQAGQFDAVITISSAIGHLTKTGFEKALRNIRRNLNPNGLYLFDIFNINSMMKKNIESLKLNDIKNLGKIQIQHKQYSEINQQKNHLVSYDEFIIQKNNQKPEIIKNKFALQIYSPTEIREMLAKYGFKVLSQLDMNSKKFSEKASVEFLTIAQLMI